MGKNSAIEWTNHTFNPFIGCTRVSEGCVNCYAENMSDRFKLAEWGPKGERIRTSANYWRQPLRWDADAKARGTRDRVFGGSMCDPFDDHPSITTETRAEYWRLIEQTPNLDWLLLTKRPENWPAYLPVIEPGERFRHLRLGVTIENDEARKKRAPLLLLASQLGWPTFISYEPALGQVDWSFLPALNDTWLIAGGESGPHARPPHPDWFRTARDAAALAEVPFFFKQWGNWVPGGSGQSIAPDGSSPGPALWNDPSTAWMRDVGKKNAGRLLDGVEHSAFPPSPEIGTANTAAVA